MSDWRFGNKARCKLFAYTKKYSHKLANLYAKKNKKLYLIIR